MLALTPTALALHREHVARRARIAQAAARPPQLQQQIGAPPRGGADPKCACCLPPLVIAPPAAEPAFVRITIARIIRICAEHYGLSMVHFHANRRLKKLVRARQAAMYLARKYTLLSYPQIGLRLGDRDHTTVMHGIRVTERRLTTEAAFAADFAQLEAKVVGTVGVWRGQ